MGVRDEDAIVEAELAVRAFGTNIIRTLSTRSTGSASREAWAKSDYLHCRDDFRDSSLQILNGDRWPIKGSLERRIFWLRFVHEIVVVLRDLASRKQRYNERSNEC